MRRRPSIRLRVGPLEPREMPANVPLLVFGADAGAAPRVRVIERETGTVRFDFLAYPSSFLGGVRVAVGDVTGDGQDDVITGSGPGARPVVRVFDGDTGAPVHRFLPPSPAIRVANYQRSGHRPNPYAGGVTVAAGDVNGDGRADVITGSGVGSVPAVNIFDGRTGRKLSAFLAAGGSNLAGVRVAAGDLDGDGRAEIITGPASGSGTEIRVFDGKTRQSELIVRALFAPNNGGVYVAAADADGDGQAELVLGAGSSSRVEIRDGRTGNLRTTFDAAVNGSTGVRVGSALISPDGQADVVVGSAGAGEWAAHDGQGQLLSENTLSGFNTGVWVAASPEQEEINRHAAGVILDWNAAALSAIRTNRTAPPVASRALAILQTAVFDAVNGIARGFEEYLVPANAPRGASVRAAAIQAAHTVLTALFANQTTQFDALRTSGLLTVADGQPKSDGLAWGETVAHAVLADRASDGWDMNPPYTPGTDPGDWQPTAPANAPALLPGWGDVTPFGINNVTPFVSSDPPELSSPQWADEFNEVKRLGAKTGSDRTADQTEIATFWADGAGTFTPPGHWNVIAGQLAQEDGLSLLETARLFAHLDIAEADAAIVCWKTKFEYNFWRPVTAIRNADSDGNDATVADSAWEPLLVTPPFPDYTSGHSTFSGAASTILAGYFGAERDFSTQSDDGVVTRSFTSFAQAADEAGMSRVYGGIHFQSANLNGLTCGREIADRVLANVLQSR